ncbi:molybdopterin converting factor small subunit [Pseudochelatococcus lubricantis]|uniref:Molybdopterin converting factor small subunit n=1 Tax=Pseudochelatococcus lubricantis TaxID=1538102 RepID=A0ABX0V5Q0_9HYPH|nr:MoaD/ThiS family protein [Pseudochelatococcus lubricantis]NIJ59795.1 molybdopterin converting factor small subunit [Pseudochelatococcus lubricantis]
MSNVLQEASVTVLFFGRLSDRCGRSAVVAIPASGTRIGELRGLLEAAFGSPDAPSPFGAGTRAAVDKVAATDDTPVLPGQEIAFFSAVSGG